MTSAVVVPDYGPTPPDPPASKSGLRRRGLLAGAVGAAIGTLASELLLSVAFSRSIVSVARPIALALLPVGPALGALVALRRRNYPMAIPTSILIWAVFARLVSGDDYAFVWLVVGANVHVPLLFPPWGPLVGPVVASFVAVLGLGVGWSIDLANRHVRLRVKLDHRWIALAWIIVLGWFASFTFVQVVQAQRVVNRGWQESRAFTLSLFDVPNTWAICLNTLDSGCAQRTADEEGGVIAYLPPPQGYRFLQLKIGVLYGDSPGASEQLIAEGGTPWDVWLVTGWNDGTRLRNAHVVWVDGVELTVAVDVWGRGVLANGRATWEKDGQRFCIWIRGDIFPDNLSEGDLINLYRQVRYAYPTPAPSLPSMSDNTIGGDVVGAIWAA